MKFKSTRGAEVNSFSEAFNQGLASDGGLFVPEYFPDISAKLDFFSTLSYPLLVTEFMSLFAEEIHKDEWLGIAEQSYSTFSVSSPDKVLIKKLSRGEVSTSDDIEPQVPSKGCLDLSILELFHGPTLAFKDFALQVVGRLYERECLKYRKTYSILGATSGDTGSAAIYGILENDGVQIFMMYPEGKIAPEQELQITTTEAKNVFPIAIQGTFDDAQAIVKEVFADKEFAKKVGLAAVNSINIARILVQSVYYLFTYLKIRKEQILTKDSENLSGEDSETLSKGGTLAGNKKIRFIVPTGNFGNVLSGWFLNNMGLDCDFVIATNNNDVLHTLWQTGEYKKKVAKVTHAPSMDIQQASNFERLLYFMYDKDPKKVCDILNEFKEKSAVQIDMNRAPRAIASVSTSDAEIEEAIKKFYIEYKYVLDPHTACACRGIDSNAYNVILATASPAKFPEVIEKCIGIIPKDERLEQLRTKEKIFVTMKADAGEIKRYMESVLCAR